MLIVVGQSISMYLFISLKKVNATFYKLHYSTINNLDPLLSTPLQQYKIIRFIY